jgi:VanZ family protein
LRIDQTFTRVGKAQYQKEIGPMPSFFLFQDHKSEGLIAVSTVFKVIFGVLLAIATHQSLTPKFVEVLQDSPDKFLHLICWATLSASLYLAVRPTHRYGLQLIALFGYATILEIAQLWVPGRHLHGGDVTANAAGCLLIYGIIKLLEWRWPSLKTGAT